MSTYNIEMNLLNSSSSYDVLYPKVNLSNSQGSLPAFQISSGTFGTGDYTIPGNLTLKGSGNYGTKINLGDGDYVHISEPTDDCLEIKGKKINFVTTDTSSSGLTWNNSAIGGNSDSVLKYKTGIYTGNGANSFNITIGSFSVIVNFFTLQQNYHCIGDTISTQKETDARSSGSFNVQSIQGKLIIPSSSPDNTLNTFYGIYNITKERTSLYSLNYYSNKIYIYLNSNSGDSLTYAINCLNKSGTTYNWYAIGY